MKTLKITSIIITIVLLCTMIGIVFIPLIWIGYFSMKKENDGKIKSLQKDIKSLQTEVDEFTKNELNNYIDSLDDEIINFTEFSSKELNKLEEREKSLKELIKGTNNKFIIKAQLTLDGNKTKGKMMQSNLGKLGVKAFEATAKESSAKVTAKNYQAKIKGLESKFNEINKNLDSSLIKLNKKLLEYAKTEVSLSLAKKQEKERLKLKEQEKRRRLKEQAEIDKEVMKEQKKIANEKMKVEKELARLQKMELNLQTNNVENDEIKELRKQIEAFKSKIEYLEEEDARQTKRKLGKSGYVYIISNPGAYGENYFKIGVTRRDNPIERINELHNAAVPFKWSTHAIIFSDDAFDLESKLHKHFDDKRVNKVNTRKEHFKVSLDEIKKVVSENYNDFVQWNFDYSETDEVIASGIKLSKNINN